MAYLAEGAGCLDQVCNMQLPKLTEHAASIQKANEWERGCALVEHTPQSTCPVFYLLASNFLPEIKSEQVGKRLCGGS